MGLAQELHGQVPVGAESVEAIADSAAADADVQPAGLVRLSPRDEIWIASRQRQVVVGGQICLRNGVLEMLACPQGTKEHESIIAVNCKAYLVHAALLALGLKAGIPARFDPDYVAAKGHEIEIEVLWSDQQGKAHKVRAQHWVRRLGETSSLEQPWVFVGSGFWTDEETGKRYYYAEAGELICVSNFSTATLDLPISSSQSEDELLFEANTDEIPPVGTKVKLILRPAQKPSQFYTPN